MNKVSPSDLGPAGIKDPFALFSYLVETGGRVIVTSDEPMGTLIRLGYQVDINTKDLRLLGVTAESLDAIWWSKANVTYSIEDTFRILQALFKGLKPKKGILALSFLKVSKDNPWSVRTVMTLLRQTGFQLFHSFESADEHLFFCQRL